MLNKKAFTLVELSVVLVVIGIILGMATKGKDLVRIAQVKAEAIKMIHMQTGVTTYFSSHKELPYQDGSTDYYNTDVLLDGNYIAKADLVNALDGLSPWGLRDCTVHTNDAFRWSTGKRGICFTSLNSDNSMMSELACNMEMSYDDRNLLGGKGRVLSDSLRANYSDTDYNRCSALASRDVYAFRILQLR